MINGANMSCKINTKQILTLISPIPCSVNHYIKPRPFIIDGKAQVTMYETAEAKKYKKDLENILSKKKLNESKVSCKQDVDKQHYKK